MIIDTDKLLAYTRSLEAANMQLVIALKRSVEVLAKVEHPCAKDQTWQNMFEDFEKIIEVGEDLTKYQPL